LDTDEVYTVQWEDVSETVTVQAEDWLERPLRWIKSGTNGEPEAEARISKEGPGIAFSSMTWIYSTDKIPEASEPGIIAVDRKFFRRIKQGEKYHLKPIQKGDTVSVGDEIEVQIKINTGSQFEYMHLKDPLPAGFECETLLSGWTYDPLWYYMEPRDSLVNFFLSRLPHGEYILRYRIRPTKPGKYRVGAATLQSMYAPDMTAHSSGFIMKVE